jgi:hypothetical protein
VTAGFKTRIVFFQKSLSSYIVHKGAVVSTRMLLTIREDQADAQGLDELTIALRRELFDLGVDDVERVHEGAAPANTRGLDAASIGVLLVTFNESIGAVGGIVGLIRSWLGSAPAGRSVEMTVGDKTLKLSSVSREQQDELIGEFVQALSRK